MDSRKVYSRDFLQCGEIITVVTIKLCKRKFFSFFIKIVKSCIKETGSNFVLLSQSKNTIEWFKKMFQRKSRFYDFLHAAGFACRRN